MLLVSGRMTIAEEGGTPVATDIGMTMGAAGARGRLDEPLEHLDPQLRHAVAATLATATRGGSPRQLLVTTYEDSIARQLADDIDGAEIVTIRESGVTVGPN